VAQRSRARLRGPPRRLRAGRASPTCTHVVGPRGDRRFAVRLRNPRKPDVIHGHPLSHRGARRQHFCPHGSSSWSVRGCRRGWRVQAQRRTTGCPGTGSGSRTTVRIAHADGRRRLRQPGLGLSRLSATLHCDAAERRARRSASRDAHGGLRPLDVGVRLVGWGYTPWGYQCAPLTHIPLRGIYNGPHDLWFNTTRRSQGD
jgi:hypothetical protein